MRVLVKFRGLRDDHTSIVYGVYISYLVAVRANLVTHACKVSVGIQTMVTPVSIPLVGHFCQPSG